MAVLLFVPNISGDPNADVMKDITWERHLQYCKKLKIIEVLTEQEQKKKTRYNKIWWQDTDVFKYLINNKSSRKRNLFFEKKTEKEQEREVKWKMNKEGHKK